MTDTIFYSVIGFILITLLGIISYLLKSMRSNFQRELTKVSEISQNLLQTSVQLSTSISYIKGTCTDKHTVVDKRLDEHSKTINEHTQQITQIKTIIGHEKSNR